MENVLPVVTAGDVIHKRQIELLKESQEVRGSLEEMQERIASMRLRLAEIDMEYQLLDDMRDHGRVTVVRETLTATIHTGAGGRRLMSDRVTFEDALRKIFEAAGRPMSPKEIMSQLERFNYQWSSYQSAYAAIKSSDSIEKIGGVRGMFQFRR